MLGIKLQRSHRCNMYRLCTMVTGLIGMSDEAFQTRRLEGFARVFSCVLPAFYVGWVWVNFKNVASHGFDVKMNKNDTFIIFLLYLISKSKNRKMGKSHQPRNALTAPYRALIIYFLCYLKTTNKSCWMSIANLIRLLWKLVLIHWKITNQPR